MRRIRLRDHSVGIERSTNGDTYRPSAFPVSVRPGEPIRAIAHNSTRFSEVEFTISDPSTGWSRSRERDVNFNRNAWWDTSAPTSSGSYELSATSGGPTANPLTGFWDTHTENIPFTVDRGSPSAGSEPGAPSKPKEQFDLFGKIGLGGLKGWALLLVVLLGFNILRK